MNSYYVEIDHLIRKNEINRKARYFKDNSDTLETYYWKDYCESLRW